MEGQQLFNAVLTLGSAVIGWILKAVWESIKDLKNEIKELTVEVHQDFVRRDDFKDSMKEIKDMLSKIFDKLDEKADKSNG